MAANLIQTYHQRGFKYTDIVALLHDVHGIGISLRQLKRKLSELGLFRRKNFSDPYEILGILSEELITRSNFVRLSSNETFVKLEIWCYCEQRDS